MPKIVLEFANFQPTNITGIAKYPAVTRDISMVVPKHVLAGQIEDISGTARRKDPGELSAV